MGQPERFRSRWILCGKFIAGKRPKQANTHDSNTLDLLK